MFDSDDGGAVATLPSLQRIISYFDFEEPDAAPNALPAHFYRYIAPSQGFPPFGSMKLSNSAAFEGISSLEFDLGGGSMSARIGTAVVPILPNVDYSVSAKVKSEGLHHAKARLVAWLHDKFGQPIHSSLVQSRLVNTLGAWETLAVNVPGEFADAADLVIDLQVLQPAQYDGEAIERNRPRLEDIGGRVWFDDVIISHLPRISLRMPQPGNIVHAPELPAVIVQVNELTSDGGSLTARLRVLDLNGKSVFDSTFPAPRGRRGTEIRLPVTKCGWYRTVLDVKSKAGLSQQHWLDFAVLGGKSRAVRVPSGGFGLVIGDSTIRAMSKIPEMAALAGAGSAIVPIWSRASGSTGDTARQDALRVMIEQLLLRHVNLIFSLDVVPDQLARSTGLESNQVSQLVEKDPRLWRGLLDDVLVNFGLEVNRWRIGPPDGTESMWTGNLPSVMQAATRSFADYVPDPRMLSSWTIELTAGSDEGSNFSAYSIHVPYRIPPEGLQEYATKWINGGSADDLITTLSVLPADSYTPRQQVIDLMVRALHAWRAGLKTLVIEAPWREREDAGIELMPAPAFGPWRNLSEQLSGRVFAGELSLPEGQHCWILRGGRPDDGALVAWTDNLAHSSPSDQLHSQLSGDVVNVIDAFGNATRVSPSRNVHTIQLSDMPVFINNVSVELVEFRSGFAIKPDFVPAVAKIHEHQIVLRNPWPVVASGTIRLSEDSEWKLTPLWQEFVIPPGGEVQLPLNIIPQRSIVAGRKYVQADITLHADQNYSMHLQTPLDVGLKNIDLSASWRVAHNPLSGQNDLVITETVTNKSDHPVNLDIDLLAAGLGQNRRTIGGLGPGETAVRTFRIANGAATLGGKQVRVGVAERDGATHLNHLLLIPRHQPALSATAAPATVFDH